MRTPTLKPPSLLIYPAVLLSAASLAWTSWSLVDLLGAGTIGVTVAAGADIIWGSVILAEARALRIRGRRWPVAFIGWAAVLTVAGFLVWHGVNSHSPAMAAAGPFLPAGAKLVWLLALADMRNPAALTDDEQQQLAELERGMAFEEAQHAIEMRRRRMSAELQLAQLDTDFDIERLRQDKQRELHRNRPIELGAAAGEQPAAIAPPAPSAPEGGAPAAPVPPQQSAPHGAPHHEAPLRPVPPPADTARHDRTDDLLNLDGLSKAEAVRLMRKHYPDATAPQLVRRLAEHGIEAKDGYVRNVLSRDRQTAPKPAEGNGFYP